MQGQEISPSIPFQNLESKAHAPEENPWLRGLNAQQAAAVSYTHHEGAVLVLAGAGSGKTTVLTRRIAQIYASQPKSPLARDGRPHILALTFTKDAAQEMAARVKILLGLQDEPADFPKIGTFHAFAYGLICASTASIPNWQRLGYRLKPVLVDVDVKRKWLASLDPKLDLDLDLNQNQNQNQNPEMSLVQAEEWLVQPFAEDDCKDSIRAKLRGRFRSFLYDTGGIAFDDMVTLALRLLNQAPEVRADFQAHIQTILVDEFQDTSLDQLELVQVLLGESRDLFLVGDDDQAIYGFRGANPNTLDAALKRFPGMRILKLEINYRSTVPIVNFANSVFTGKPKHLQKNLVAGRVLVGERRSSPVRKIRHREGAFQARWLAEEIKRLHQDEGLAWNEIALIYRINALEPYYRTLVHDLVGKVASQEMVFNTVHGSKGLEYPAVFFVGLEDGILPYRKKQETLAPERLAEEKRIFYVGVTRAQRYLYLCSVKRRFLRGKQTEAEVSPFLQGKFKSLWHRLTRRE